LARTPSRYKFWFWRSPANRRCDLAGISLIAVGILKVGTARPNKKSDNVTVSGVYHRNLAGSGSGKK
jgi:hypothetical protein